LWQIHVFGEGNTRTTAVFLIKYLRKLSFKNINNDLFAQHSWYFRNALVRANYADISRNIDKTEIYLNRFLSNLVFGEKNVLKNRELHVNFVETENVVVKQENDTANNIKFGVNQEKMLSLIENTPTITVNEMAKLLGISERAIEKNLAKFKEMNILTRIGSDKTGNWKINEKKNE